MHAIIQHALDFYYCACDINSLHTIIRDHFGHWIINFSLNLGHSTCIIAELGQLGKA